MKRTFTLSVLLAAASVSFAQTAKNFTASDCGGTSHTLFDELDKGKVVVMVWIMPCAACEGPSKTAYNTVQSYAVTNTGKVLYYLIDDYGDSPCADLETFASTKIGDKTKMTIFANTGNAIKMSEYGGSGMPKVLVAAGKDHKIFFDKKNAAANDATGLKKAIDSAIVSTNVENIPNDLKFMMTPNPVTNTLTVTYAKEIKKVVITSISGQVVLEQSFPTGQMNPVIDMSKLKSAIYMVRIVDMQDREGVQKIMKQ